MKVILALAIICLAFCAAQAKRHGHGRGGFGGVKACRIQDSNGVELDSSSCYGGYNCTEKGLDIQINETAYEVYYCNYPYPTLRMACRVEGAIASSHRRQCPDSVQCNNGPYSASLHGTTFQYYICGNETDSKIDFAGRLSRGACDIAGTAQYNCSDNAPCDGAEITLAGNKLTFCKGPNNDDDFSYLELFDKHEREDKSVEKSQEKSRNSRPGKSSSSEESKSESSVSNSESEESESNESGQRGRERGNRRRSGGRRRNGGRSRS